MTLNASGPISLAGTTAGQSIEVELGGIGTTQISLNCSSVRTLAGVPSGAIVMPTNFYGKSNSFNYTISASTTNFCLRAGAVAAGWNQSSKLLATINSGVVISATNSSTPALTIAGSFPGGVTLTNNGLIVGRGGNGGTGSVFSPTNGSAGFTGIKVTSTVTINNTSGTIAGGGGGGGGAGGAVAYGHSVNGGGGGGGAGNGSAGSGGSGAGNGTNTTGGAGGTGDSSTFNVCCVGCVTITGGNGGAGGGMGAAGANGSSCVTGGGGGGKATCGAGTYITWNGTGTRYGSIS